MTLRQSEAPSSSFMDAVSDGASRMSSAFFIMLVVFVFMIVIVIVIVNVIV